MRSAAAGQIGTCLVCQGSYWDGPHAAGRTHEEFVADHETCRRTILDREGRPDDCLCRECKARKGVTTTQSVPPSARKRNKGRTYSKHRQLVFERDNFTCQVCLLPTDPGARPTDDQYPTLDHIFSLALGGDDDPDNLRTAHRWCNLALSSEGGLVYDQQVREAALRRFSSAESSVEP
ncbi:HNH endonuclease [Pseudarthrobacter sp. NPDC092184]